MSRIKELNPLYPPCQGDKKRSSFNYQGEMKYSSPDKGRSGGVKKGSLGRMYSTTIIVFAVGPHLVGKVGIPVI